MTAATETPDDILLSSSTHSSRATRNSLRLSRNALIFTICLSLLTIRNFISIGTMNLSNFNDWIGSDSHVDFVSDEGKYANQSIHLAVGSIDATDETNDDDTNDDVDPDTNDEKNEEQTTAPLPVENDDGSSDDDTNDDDKESIETTEGGPHDSRMNVLLLYPDDWRHDSIGSEKPYVLTPFLDSLAKEGIRFTQNAVTTSVCWMSRATLWMGQYSSRHKSYKLKCPWMAAPENWKHGYVSIMQKAGYFVGHYGKWQYWTDPNKFTKHLFDWASLYEGRHWEGRIHASDFAVQESMAFFDARPKDKPFVFSVAFYPPKALGDSREPGEQLEPTDETLMLYNKTTIPEPISNTSFYKLPKFLHSDRTGAVQKFHERYRTPIHYQTHMKKYYALVTGIDGACEKIVDRLKQDGLYNSTIIIFTTDNGMFHGAHGLAGKWYPYQESIRVPLIIYDPRMPENKRGTLDDSFTLNVDLAETILGAAGIKPDELMQGRDIAELYLNDGKAVEEEPWRDEFFYEFPTPQESYIPASTALVRKEWKYIKWPNQDHEELFHLKEDPLEISDVLNSPENADILNEMRIRHDELKEKYHDPTYETNGVCNNFRKEHPEIA